jgi:hypothetical protein
MNGSRTFIAGKATISKSMSHQGAFIIGFVMSYASLRRRNAFDASEKRRKPILNIDRG